MDSIDYAAEPALQVDEFIDLLVRSTLAERRPIGDRARIGAMLRNASLIVTARAGALLVGVARSVTDYSYCCYLSDLAVDRAHQRRGIGRRLMVETRIRAENGRVLDRPLRCVLLAAPAAVDYYPHVGLRRIDQAFDFSELA